MEPKKPFPPEVTAPNRRGTHRVPYNADCYLDPVAPAWSMLPRPMEATTVNVTEHGLRVDIPSFPHLRYEKWNKHISEGETITVSVRLVRAPHSLTVTGQVVWMRYEQLRPDSGSCSLGILLSLLNEDEQTVIRQIVAGHAADS